MSPPDASNRPHRWRAVAALILATALAGLVWVPSAARAATPRTVVFDAIFGKKSGYRDVPPSGDSIGDQQFANGPLHDRKGRRVGSFTFTCTWIAVAGDRVDERCAGAALLADGRLTTRGPALRSDASHRWRVTGGTRAYAHARGSVVVHDLGTDESIIVATLTAGAPRHPPGEVPHPAGNRGFIVRAQAVCAGARSALTGLPPFPLDTFDPRHPTADQLSTVGAYFTGPGDPRPALRIELAQLTALGGPPSQQGAWDEVLASRNAFLSTAETQDAAALSRDIPGFVASLARVSSTIRREALAVAVFGALGCYPR